MIPYLIGMESFLPAMKVLRAAGRGLLPNKKTPGWGQRLLCWSCMDDGYPSCSPQEGEGAWKKWRKREGDYKFRIISLIKNKIPNNKISIKIIATPKTIILPAVRRICWNRFWNTISSLRRKNSHQIIYSMVLQVHIKVRVINMSLLYCFALSILS